MQIHPNNPGKNRYQADYTGLLLEERPFARIRDHYGEERTYRLDVMRAEGNTDRSAPVVLFIHGGGFVEPGDKRQDYISLFAKELARSGCVVVSPDYPVFRSDADRRKIAGESLAKCCPLPARAVSLAARYIRENGTELGIDPGRMAIMGGSAGGMTACYAVALEPNLYRFFVNLWGVPEELPELSQFPPVLSVHGTEDEAVDYRWERPLQEGLEAAGVPHRLITLEGCRHTPLDERGSYLPEILRLVERYF